MNDERACIFVDGSNLYHCLRQKYSKANIDFQKLVLKLVGQRRLLRTYYYNVALNQDEDLDGYKDQQRFFHRLQQIDYFEAKLGRLGRRGTTHVEKGVDVQITLDMLQGAHRNIYDTAVLVSGDGDFANVVRAVKDTGKHVENVTVDTAQSRELRVACDRTILLDSAFLSALWL